MEFWCRALHHCFTKGWIAMGAIGTLASVVLPFLRQLDPRAAAHHDFWDFVDRYGVAWLCIAVFWLIVGVRFLYAPYWLYAKILRQRDAARSGLTAARNTLKRIPRMTSDFAKLKICFAGDNQTPTPVEMVNVPFYYALAQQNQYSSSANTNVNYCRVKMGNFHHVPHSISLTGCKFLRRNEYPS